MYNNETRKKYPTYVGYIKTKEGPDMICDPDLCEVLVTSLNSKGLIWSDLYQKTIHAFNIEYIEKVKTTDEHRKLIDQLIIKRDELSQNPILSFNQSLQGIKLSSQKNLLNNKKEI